MQNYKRICITWHLVILMDTQDKIKSAEMNWSNEEGQRLIDQYTIDKL